MSEESLQDWLKKLPAHFLPEKSAGMNAVVQVNLSGNQSGAWYITIQNQTVRVDAGVASNPRLTIEADSQDILSMLSGKMDPMRAFMQGKVKVSGDMSLAMKIANLFHP